MAAIEISAWCVIGARCSKKTVFKHTHRSRWKAKRRKNPLIILISISVKRWRSHVCNVACLRWRFSIYYRFSWFAQWNGARGEKTTSGKIPIFASFLLWSEWFLLLASHANLTGAKKESIQLTESLLFAYDALAHVNAVSVALSDEFVHVSLSSKRIFTQSNGVNNNFLF